MDTRLPEWMTLETYESQDGCCGHSTFSPPLFTTLRALEVYGRETILAAWRYLQAQAKELPGLPYLVVFIDTTGQHPDLYFVEDTDIFAPEFKETIASLPEEVDRRYYVLDSPPVEYVKLGE